MIGLTLRYCFFTHIGETPQGVPHKRPATAANLDDDEEGDEEEDEEAE